MEQKNELPKRRGRKKGGKNRKSDPVELREALRRLNFDPVEKLVGMLSTCYGRRQSIPIFPVYRGPRVHLARFKNGPPSKKLDGCIAC
jgi:hypothetical protein